MMIALASGAGLRPFLATGVGAAVGGVTNFFLGRAWIFCGSAACRDRRPTQAVRYAIAALGSLCLNSAGVYVLHDALGAEYVFARVIGAMAVSVAYNFPIHRHYVFAHGSCFDKNP